MPLGDLAMHLPQPPIDRYRIRLRFTRPTRFRFLHGGVLRGLVSRALRQHELPPGIIPFAPESGRIRFAAGDAYNIGLTLVGEDRGLAGRLFAGLVQVGQRALTPAPRPTLGGNFELEAVEPLPAIDLDRELAALAAAPAVILQMLSPLRMRRPDGLSRPGATYLNAECFPAAFFLERLWARLALLTAGRADAETLRRRMPQVPSAARAVSGDMPWLDLPMAGGSGQERSYTLGGVMGCVRLRALTPDWLPALALGRHLHVGAGTAYGLGRYRLLEDGSPEPFQPARPRWSHRTSADRTSTADLVEELRTDLAAHLEDSSQAFRLGLNHAGSARGERAALDARLSWRREADLGELATLVDPRMVAQRARALFPLDPPPRPTAGTSPVLEELHALLVLPEIAAAVAPERKLLRMQDGYFLLERRPAEASGAFAQRSVTALSFATAHH